MAIRNRSTCLKFPFTTTNQTTNAEIGTEIYLCTPKSSMLAAMPANSAMMTVRFAKTNSAMTASVTRMPNCSRTRSPNPLPVTTPIRDDISWITARANVIRMSAHRRPYPSRAPTMEYVAMPPASLPAFPAMKPGPDH